ncbi:hypothetical protein DNTS_027535 [Danionella cerebrum]|uniref:Uncharacterized protein n=1 Tax=Danionella cerebrum TaxID=2873325 RepID=A0A553R2R0_9TELE|nr:hypothetical protein DNTS_027535 [Danionella translucida]
MSVRLREAEAQAELKETRQRMLEQETQNQIYSNQLRRAELEARNLQDRMQVLTTQNKTLHAELQETKRKQAEIECKNKEEVMAKEEGKVQGQLNNTDSSQYIRDLKDQITDLKHEIRCLRGKQNLPEHPSFDGIHIVNHYGGDTESYQSSDEDGGKLSPQLGSHQLRGRITLHPNLEDSESDAEDEGDVLRLTVPSNSSHKSTTV